jgi:hypothetical protein
MGVDLLELRDDLMSRVDRTLEAAGPERKGEDFARALTSAATSLESLVRKMPAAHIRGKERSRTYRYLGGIYLDLAPSEGPQMFSRAMQAYEKAEALLKSDPDDLEQAKLDFNLASALRHIDPNDIEKLREAKRRLLCARDYFVTRGPQYLDLVDSELQWVETLFTLAPMAREVKENGEEMAVLQAQLKAGGNVQEVAAKARTLMRKGGGVSALIGRLQPIVDSLPVEEGAKKKRAEIQEQMRGLIKRLVGPCKISPEEGDVWSALRGCLESEMKRGAVSEDHAEALKGILDEFGGALSSDDGDLSALMTKVQRLREVIERRFEMNHYLSHGIERPSADSRAASQAELNWESRRYLLEELNRAEIGEEESRDALALSVRGSGIDRRIYECGADDARAVTVEKEELRPFWLAVRGFSARSYTMPARPTWQAAKMPVDTDGVFYSGPKNGAALISRACRRAGLEVMPEPRGERYASARWKQLQEAVTAVFDLRTADAGKMAAITYELGMALTLGRPVVVLVAEAQTMPFDIDVSPVVLSGGQNGEREVLAGIDRSLVWTHERLEADASSKTVGHVLSVYGGQNQNRYADQTLRMLGELGTKPDPLSVSRKLEKFFEYRNDGETMLVHPWWPPVYPAERERRLFHVTPFQPDWARAVTAWLRKGCVESDVTYVRADEAREPDVIRSIWEELTRATHVVVDLSVQSSNVALELGITHTLGTQVLLLAQGDPERHLFPSISKHRVYSYNVETLDDSVGEHVRAFLSRKRER